MRGRADSGLGRFGHLTEHVPQLLPVDKVPSLPPQTVYSNTFMYVHSPYGSLHDYGSLAATPNSRGHQVPKRPNTPYKTKHYKGWDGLGPQIEFGWAQQDVTAYTLTP